MSYICCEVGFQPVVGKGGLDMVSSGDLHVWGHFSNVGLGWVVSDPFGSLACFFGALFPDSTYLTTQRSGS